MKVNVLLLCLGLLTSYFGSCTCTSSAQSPEEAKFEPTARNADEQEVLLSELIQRFSSVLSLATDGDLYREIHNEFTNLLEEYVARNPPCSHVSRLLHAAILGVFRLHNGVTKDSLASNAALQVNRSTIADYARWSLDLVNILLSQTGSDDRDGGNCSTADVFNRLYAGRTALRLSVELRLLEVSKLLIDKGATVISTTESLDIESENVHDVHACDFAYLILPAIKNDDAEMTSLIVRLMKASKQYLSCSDCMCTALNTVCDRTATDSEFSPLQVAYLHCVLLSTCEVYEYLVTEAGPSCVLNIDSNTVSLVLKHATPVCPGLQFTSRSSYNEKNSQKGPDLCHELKFGSGVSVRSRRSGWAVYSDFTVGRRGCDLPKLKLEDLENDAFKLLDNLHIPVVIEGATEGWKTWEVWKRHSLRANWPEVDLLLGSIPYAEVFGETSGYATVSETLAYMDSYAHQEALRFLSEGEPDNWGKIQLPFYVFDNNVIEENFANLYSLPSYFSNWIDSTPHQQFILGPAGSGAPFHFHCPALNALVYGRKKWFLHPPGRAVYSKQHPLRWYAQYYTHLSSDQNQFPVECVQESGQLLYVPSGWSHATINLDEAIGLAVEFEQSHC